MAAECVKVIVRCRPMNEREKSLKCKTVLNIDSNLALCVMSNPNEDNAVPKSFTFDGAYDINSSTEEIYNDIAYPLIEGVTEGYNGTIFAYGQTGCGKSFTMQGVTDPTSQRGIIPRAFDHIFETVSVTENAKFLIRASYLEIYNEEIRDLLGKDNKAPLCLKEHPEKGVYVQGLSYHTVQSVSDCAKIMEKGWNNRTTGATLMNKDSSRSHSIFTIQLEMITTDSSNEEHIRAGKLNLVDLAGSERQYKTGATGDRLKEASKINLSLSALGNVISALVNAKVKHVPYRDSRLTRLLQDSLGGNTKTLMVACLSPADNNYDETLSTLRYANRAKNIKNKPKINEDPKDALLRAYQEEIVKLKALLLGKKSPPNETDNQSKRLGSTTPVHRKEELAKEKIKLKTEYELQFATVEAKYQEERQNRAKLEEELLKLKEFYDSKQLALDGELADLPLAKGSPSKDSMNASENTSPVTVSDEDSNRCSPSRIHGISNGKQDINMNDLLENKDQDGAQQEVMKRLQELQQQMVGGEAASNQEMKEKRKNKIKFAENRKAKLAEAIANMDDDYIMLDIYENIQDEVKAVSKQLAIEKRKVVRLQSEFADIQSEFDIERLNYTDLIQKQDCQIQLLQAILDRVQPCLRRDCNYFNLDKIKAESRWDDDNKKWILPKLIIEKTVMPPVDATNLTVVSRGFEQKSHPNSTSLARPEEDKLREKLWKSENNSNSYFQTRRSSQLAGESGNKMSISQIKEGISSLGNLSNPQHHPLQTPSSLSGFGETQIETPTTRVGPSGGCVTDPINDPATIRRPLRLEALQTNQHQGKKLKKKKNTMNGPS